MAQMVKNLPAIWETQVQSLDWKGPLEKVMATHSSIFARGIPWTERPGRLYIFFFFFSGCSSEGRKESHISRRKKSEKIRAIKDKKLWIMQ